MEEEEDMAESPVSMKSDGSEGHPLDDSDEPGPSHTK